MSGRASSRVSVLGPVRIEHANRAHAAEFMTLYIRIYGLIWSPFETRCWTKSNSFFDRRMNLLNTWCLSWSICFPWILNERLCFDACSRNQTTFDEKLIPSTHRQDKSCSCCIACTEHTNDSHWMHLDAMKNHHIFSLNLCPMNWHSCGWIFVKRKSFEIISRVKFVKYGVIFIIIIFG